jgi:hypothetical protein
MKDFPIGTEMMGCSICDYDLCYICLFESVPVKKDKENNKKDKEEKENIKKEKEDSNTNKYKEKTVQAKQKGCKSCAERGSRDG